MSRNFAKSFVWKHEYDVKLWRQKQPHQIQMTDHHMPLNETTPHENFLRTPLRQSLVSISSYRKIKKRSSSQWILFQRKPQIQVLRSEFFSSENPKNRNQIFSDGFKTKPVWNKCFSSCPSRSQRTRSRLHHLYLSNIMKVFGLRLFILFVYLFVSYSWSKPRLRLPTPTFQNFRLRLLNKKGVKFGC